MHVTAVDRATMPLSGTSDAGKINDAESYKYSDGHRASGGFGGGDNKLVSDFGTMRGVVVRHGRRVTSYP